MNKKEEKHITKTLASCTPIEFLKQTNRVRKSVEKWLTATDIMNIRRRLPELPENISEDDRKKAVAEQVSNNLSAILDAILDDHPDETLALLAMLCFIEPEDANDYPVEDYLNALAQLLGNTAVINFFTSLATWGQIGIQR